MEPPDWSNLDMWMADTDKPLKRHKDSGEDGDGEADLGEGEEEREEMGKDVELVIWRELRNGENEV